MQNLLRICYEKILLLDPAFFRGDYPTIAAFYQYQITPNVRLNQDLSYEYGDQAQTLRSRTAFSADLSKKFAAVASYNIKDTHADAGNSRDSLLSLDLRYKH